MANKKASQAFPFLELSGSAEQIGLKAGSVLADRILEICRIYNELFLKISGLSAIRTEKRISELSAYFASQTADIFPELDLEIRAMAEAASVDKNQIYTLNARTEIFHALKYESQAGSAKNEGECTAIYAARPALLAQNWDWMPELENLCIVSKISCDNKPGILTFTEPGVLAKIGINSEGLAVCLNILFDNCEIRGIPVHILLRAILKCKNVHDALSLIESIPLGTCSNIMLADSSGHAINLEIKGNKLNKFYPSESALIHTNHYIEYENSANSTVPGSVERYERARKLFDENAICDIETIKAVLADQNGQFPICRPYGHGTYFMVGTVAATIAKLKEKSLLVCKGQPVSGADWAEYSFK